MSPTTHQSSTDADARLYRKASTASQLRFMGHTLADHRHGLIASAMVTTADGFAEREAAKVIPDAPCEVAGEDVIHRTVGADKGYDAKEFIEACLDWGVTPPTGDYRPDSMFSILPVRAQVAIPGNRLSTGNRVVQNKPAMKWQVPAQQVTLPAPACAQLLVTAALPP